MTTEPLPTALALAVAGTLLVASALFTRASERIGVPVLLIFLAIGMLARATSYEVVRVDGIEHNEKIDDRIVAEIRKSAIVVADFTGQRQNVYFEAGFALGLGGRSSGRVGSRTSERLTSTRGSTTTSSGATWRIYALGSSTGSRPLT